MCIVVCYFLHSTQHFAGGEAVITVHILATFLLPYIIMGLPIFVKISFTLPEIILQLRNFSLLF